MSGVDRETDAGAARAELQRWLAVLESRYPRGEAGIELGLERILRVKGVLGQEPACPVITVAGTNGKGSTCAYLEAIYHFAGYRVGCYTSPHLLEYNERVRVDSRPVDDAALCAAFEKVEAASKLAGESAAEAGAATAGAVPLTYFEFATLAAMEVFRAQQVEVLILEIGLGGRLDAVNAYEPDCALVTGIALDHTDWLGPTRAAIGYEKAGIYRAGKPALCADPDPPQSLVDHAQAIGADLYLLGRDFGYLADSMQWIFWGRAGLRRSGLAHPCLRGAFQLRNASAALATVEILRARLPVSMQAVRRGLIELQLRGRFEVLPGRPAVVLDVAHNPQAVAGLADSLGGMGFFARTIAVVGMLADKDIAGSLAALAGKIDLWLLADLGGVRGAAAARLAEVVSSAGLGGQIECFASPTEAFERSAKLAGEDDRIVAFGSFYTVAAVLSCIESRRQAKRVESPQYR